MFQPTFAMPRIAEALSQHRDPGPSLQQFRRRNSPGADKCQIVVSIYGVFLVHNTVMLGVG